MNQIMTKLQKFSASEYTPLIQVLFGQSSPGPVPDDLDGPESPVKGLSFIEPNLDASQKEAVRFAIAAREVALIHGPPGVSDPGLQGRGDC